MTQHSVAPSIDAFKRGTVLLVITLGLLSTVAGWISMRVRGALTPALNRVQLITMAVLSVLLLVAWLKLLPQRAIELGCLLVAVVIYAACMVLGMYSMQYGAGILLPPLYLWIPVAYLFAFTLTDHRTGLVVSLGMFLLFLGISLPYLVQGAKAPYGNLTLQLHFVSAVLISALYFFSSYQQRLQRAQVTVDQLAQLSTTDDLTRLFNRRHMVEAVNAEFMRLAAGRGGFALILFDVDNFKAVNDRFGHGAGDAALIALAECAAEVFRGMGVLGRWGGDEFVVLVRDVDATAAVRMSEALCAHVASSPIPGGEPVTISCGVTVAMAGDKLDSLLQRADAALYAAKRAGRNRADSVLESR